LPCLTITGVSRSPKLPSPEWWRAERTSSTDTPASTAFITDWFKRCRSFATIRMADCSSVDIDDAISSERSFTGGLVLKIECLCLCFYFILCKSVNIVKYERLFALVYKNYGARGIISQWQNKKYLQALE